MSHPDCAHGLWCTWSEWSPWTGWTEWTGRDPLQQRHNQIQRLKERTARWFDQPLSCLARDGRRCGVARHADYARANRTQIVRSMYTMEGGHPRGCGIVDV